MSQSHFIFFPFLLLLIFSANSYALEWQDLWQTQDQQAEKAFQRNQYEQAAEQFSQAPWKAAAQYESGQYQQALETLNDIQTSDGFAITVDEYIGYSIDAQNNYWGSKSGPYHSTNKDGEGDTPTF